MLIIIFMSIEHLIVTVSSDGHLRILYVRMFLAGNACVLKPSECAVTCSNLLAELIPRYLDNVTLSPLPPSLPLSPLPPSLPLPSSLPPSLIFFLFPTQECYPVVTGGVSVSKAVLRERYDYIFYTGNSQVSYTPGSFKGINAIR